MVVLTGRGAGVVGSVVLLLFDTLMWIVCPMGMFVVAWMYAYAVFAVESLM
jgi:hypothetical protein